MVGVRARDLRQNAFLERGVEGVLYGYKHGEVALARERGAARISRLRDDGLGSDDEDHREESEEEAMSTNEDYHS